MESNESNKRITNERLVTVTANVRYNLPSTKPSPDGLFNYSRSGAPGLMSPQILMSAKAKYDIETYTKFCGVISANEFLKRFLDLFAVPDYRIINLIMLPLVTEWIVF